MHRGNPTEKYFSFLISQSKNTMIADDDTNNNHAVNICQMQHNKWQGSLYSANLTTPKLITACWWRTNVQWKCLNSILLAEPLPKKDLHKVAAYLCLLFQTSCASTWAKLSRLINVLKTWTTLELQQITLQILPRTIGKSSSAFARQDWKWQIKSATLKSDNLNS